VFLRAQPLNLGGINGRLAAAVDATGLGGGNPFQLPLAAQVGFKFREYPQGNRILSCSGEHCQQVVFVKTT